ncbi:sigma54 specific transcriptional regulator, Fis family [Alkaliphilus metalliredigens QYMF]|uniref:Sigma54 specific transcriptional regulator, Fis family n=1 Tax=Alkaliphilus metalliredigens (strain QYMF) TaxID=293826 RepID=A6TWN7_ALKMQ|nr:sigma 54-interacting transcriptional regulator [Alkaliphilus metalliredigens]ABR50605.1 sigma54 specific transcriptional regulator, Fis family [Alkaliphilus metalliredigens QYMF]
MSLETIKKDKHNQELLDLYKDIIDCSFNWIVVVNQGGYIILLNQAYCDFIGVEQSESIGKHVTEVIENTRMHIVVKTGRQEIGDIQKIKGNQMVANRIPLYRDGKLIGAVGTVIFKDLVEMGAYMDAVKSMEEELAFYKEELKKVMGNSHTFDSIIGSSEEIKWAKKLASKVANTKSNVLLLGESGTGKELFAQAIHNHSPRADFPLIKINCAAIPDELLESELFGYEEGAFTGAKKGGKPGKFELANKSSIFLDEIGDMPVSMQAKLLRVIQEKEIERVGGIKTYPIDVRIIAATNQDLEEMVKNKEFREDLYYRLNVINIKIPPLRDRKGDVTVIADYLLKKLSSEMGTSVTEISLAALEALQAYHWPGNIRELENVIERALNLMDMEGVIMAYHLPYFVRKSIKENKTNNHESLRVITEAVEKKVIEECLVKTRGNKFQTAKLLDISRTSLYEKIKKYGLEN